MRTRFELELLQQLLIVQLWNWKNPEEINLLSAELSAVAQAINECEP
jgi:hypothetical protein